MLGCTLKEYKDRFDKKLANYLEEYADNTPISFLENEKILFGHYQYQIQKILSELIIYGEENASEVFLESNIFEGLKKIDIDSYQRILIEEKPNDIRRFYAKVGEYRSELKVRVNFTTLKNINNSVDKIEEFLHDKYLKIQSASSLASEDTSQNKDESPEIETNVIIDPVKQLIDKNLSPYSASLSVDDYNVLTKSLLAYFETGNFPKLEKKINFRHLNKKFIGWALKEIYKSFRTDKLPIELFRFAQQNINLFEKEVIVEDNFHNSSFYKSFTTRPRSYKYPNTP